MNGLVIADSLMHYTVMKKVLIDESGVTYGRLTVMKRAPSQGNRTGAFWECICDCGKTCVVSAHRLRSGGTKSCGCLRSEAAEKAHLKHGFNRRGERPQLHKKVYDAWIEIHRRCQNPNASNFENYGGRGIKICDQWKHSFQTFLEDMGIPASAGQSIERIDNDGDYCPENCRWASKQEQNSNTRKNKFLTAHGKRLHIAEWARELGMCEATIRGRIKRGWPIAKVLTK